MYHSSKLNNAYLEFFWDLEFWRRETKCGIKADHTSDGDDHSEVTYCRPHLPTSKWSILSNLLEQHLSRPAKISNPHSDIDH